MRFERTLLVTAKVGDCRLTGGSRRRMAWPQAVLLGGLFAGAGVAGVVAGGTELVMSRSVIGSGGGHAAGQGIELSGTIAQSSTEVLSAGRLTLTGGYWLRVAPGDCHEDGDVDTLDFVLFPPCASGPAATQPEEQCQCLDVNRDNHVDLGDLAVIQAAHTGSTD